MSSLEDATWEDFSAFCNAYGLHNLEDKVIFETGGIVREVDSAQVGGPMILDLETVGKGAIQEIQRTAQSFSPEAELEMEGTSSGTTAPAESLAEGERARGQRKRVRPSWLKEFVRMEGR